MEQSDEYIVTPKVEMTRRQAIEILALDVVRHELMAEIEQPGGDNRMACPSVAHEVRHERIVEHAELLNQMFGSEYNNEGDLEQVVRTLETEGVCVRLDWLNTLKPDNPHIVHVTKVGRSHE